MFTFPYTKGSAAQSPNGAYYGFSLTPINGWGDINTLTNLSVTPTSEVIMDWQDTFFIDWLTTGYMWVAFPQSNPVFPLYTKWRDAAEYGQIQWKTITVNFNVFSNENVSGNLYRLYVAKVKEYPVNIKFST